MGENKVGMCLVEMNIFGVRRTCKINENTLHRKRVKFTNQK